jgi:hypothetical protein
LVIREILKRFILTITVVALQAAKVGNLRNVIFRMIKIVNKQAALSVAKCVIINRIGPTNCAANVWSTLKEKLRVRKHSNIEQLKNEYSEFFWGYLPSSITSAVLLAWRI